MKLFDEQRKSPQNNFSQDSAKSSAITVAGLYTLPVFELPKSKGPLIAFKLKRSYSILYVEKPICRFKEKQMTFFLELFN